MNGVGFGGLLFIVFLVLKLTNYIDWSWWIAAPLWIPVVIFLVIVLSGLMVTVWASKPKH